MKIKITWLNNGFVQERYLINYCRADKKNQTFITMNSPIYQAIMDNTFTLDIGFGKHSFTIEQII